MKNTPELCSAMIQFPTVKVNGIFGTFDYPAMSCGMLKKQKHRDALIAYVKTVLLETCAPAVPEGMARAAARGVHAPGGGRGAGRAAAAAPQSGQGCSEGRPGKGPQAPAAGGDVQEEHEVTVATAVSSARA
mmetsp:Transcript_42334/g.117124  ORF Transcript_42334/g.117124 Transcript_42334/m.117124 type:complete len:132 (+) Transcript_42334:161-556(+)